MTTAQITKMPPITLLIIFCTLAFRKRFKRLAKKLFIKSKLKAVNNNPIMNMKKNLKIENHTL